MHAEGEPEPLDEWLAHAGLGSDVEMFELAGDANDFGTLTGDQIAALTRHGTLTAASDVPKEKHLHATERRSDGYVIFHCRPYTTE